MPIEHIIQQGESTISLSEKYGLFATTIWDDPENAALKQKRKDMNVLLPGDKLVIPDKRLKELTKPSRATHRFRRKGIPALFRLQLFHIEEPRAHQDYQLIVDGRTLRGETDGDGILNESIPASAREGRLIIGPDRFELLIDFSHLCPVNEVVGIQQRLNNLGFACGEANGELNEDTMAALQEFQERFGLDVTGEIDEATRKKLEEQHDQPGDFPPLP